MTLTHYLLLGAMLFCLGLYGVLTRRNAVAVLMSLELMFNSVNINLVAFSHYQPDITGIVFAIFVITVAAAEATVGVAIVLSIYRNQAMIDTEKIATLKG
ncbi:MAG: NADH-quinone oxidoreductase subunit NuoK [Armatimonadetes bacterium]|nr:NADH-quinone oxidoreductase subunit NuoK [Armatimonadota bacterium]